MTRESSTNGRYVNGERILDRRSLVAGDRIRIGEATIELVSPLLEDRAPTVLPRRANARAA